MNAAMQTIWHQGYERALRTITSLRNHCDFKYERDTKNARKVIILNADRPIVRKYTPGEAIKRDAASVTVSYTHLFLKKVQLSCYKTIFLSHLASRLARCVRK